MEHKEIKMVGGPFAGNTYQRYDGEPRVINSPAYCVPVELIPGDYYRGIPSITTTGLRSPGSMPAKYLQDNPDLWIPIS